MLSGIMSSGIVQSVVRLTVVAPVPKFETYLFIF